MTCGSCGAPLAKGLKNCPFCGASTKYALTEQGQLPYEAQADEPQPVIAGLQPEETLEPPEPRWDLEGPQESGQARLAALRRQARVWESMENWSRVSKNTRGCLLTGFIFLLIFAMCGTLSLIESHIYQQKLALTPTPVLSASDMTATASAFPNPYLPHQGLLTLDDPLSDNSQGYYWMDDGAATPPELGCAFQNGVYVASKPAQSAPSLRSCLAVQTSFQNFTYQIDMRASSGHSGGIIFRQSAPGNFYYFYIGIDGFYALCLYTGKTNKVLAQGYSEAIHRGQNQLNRLAVVANGATLDLYANNGHLATINDKTLSTGRIGTAVGAPDREATTREFSQVEVWVL